MDPNYTGVVWFATRIEKARPTAVGAMIDDMPDIEVVVAHSERATLRVGDMFLKIDTDHARIDREVEVMARVPIPTPRVLWLEPPVLALSAVPGAALLATLTLAHEENLDEVIAGYGGRLAEHGYRAPATFPEVAVLRSLAGE